MWLQLFINNNLQLFLELPFLSIKTIEWIFNYLFLSNYNFFFFKWFEILPEILFSFFFMWRLISCLFFKVTSETTFWYYNLSILFIFYIFKFLFLGCCFNTVFFFFDYCWINTFFIAFTKFLILAFFLNYLIFIKDSISLTKTNILNELPWLLSLAVYFIFILLSSYDLFVSYLAIEGLSFTLYILASISNNNFISKEAAFKYLSIGSISSGFLLIALTWIYSVIGNLNFVFFQYHLINSNGLLEIQLKVALVLIVFAFLFKLAAFPCYFWIADVYSGILTPITFFFSTIIKLGLALFMLRFLYTICFNLNEIWSKIILISAFGSILIGALGALFQSEIKRFIAYASINQIGFFLLSLVSKSIFGVKAALLYLVVYIIMNFLFFGIILNGFNIITGRNILYFSDLNSLVDFAPFSGVILVLTLFSMAGIPPLAGFFTKTYIFCSFVNYYCWNYHFVAILLLTIISAFYYINIIRQIFFETSKVWSIFFLVSNSYNYFLFMFWINIILFWLFFFNDISYIFELLALNCVSPLLISNLIV